MNEENRITVVDATEPKVEEQSSITNIAERGDDIILLAEQAAEKVAALKKVMTAALSVTSHHDWVLIGGKPYLQESGCTKVANLLGISFEIAPGFPIIETDSKGYRTYTYRIRAFGKNTYVEGEGQRSAKDSFFSANGKKAPEEINDRDVRIAALTNAKANAIKSIIPGLKNIEVATLKDAGIDTAKLSGYTFETGKNGGKSPDDQKFTCENCGKPVNGKIASYSQSKFSGHIYCIDCQMKAANNKLKKTGEVVEPYSPEEGDE